MSFRLAARVELEGIYDTLRFLLDTRKGKKECENPLCNPFVDIECDVRYMLSVAGTYNGKEVRSKPKTCSRRLILASPHHTVRNGVQGSAGHAVLPKV